MRPGLLAVGIILLILGAMGYFLMDDTAGVETQTTSDDVQANSVRTETYATIDDDNETNTSGSWFETTSDRTTRTDTITTRTDSFETTADTNAEGVPVAYVYLDQQGNMYNEDGAFLGAGISSSDTTTTVSDRYGTTDNDRETVDDRTTNDTNDTVATGGAYDQNSNRQTVSDTTDRQTVQSDINNDDSVFADDRDTETTASTTVATGGFDWLRALSILAMVIGALLTILGLVLPNSDDVVVHDRQSRTTGTSGRRVYEREEEHRK